MTTRFLAAASAGAMALVLASPAQAEECLLDTNDNNVADAADTDDSATSDTTDSLACGPHTYAAQNAVAVGPSARAERFHSVAIGTSATTQGGNGGVAIGSGAAATGLNSIALGFQAQVADSSSIGIGGFSVVNGPNAVAVGERAAAEADSSAAFGHSAVAGGLQSTALGAGARAEAQASVALGSAIAMPGKTFTIGGNVATYNGEQGYAATITGRVSDTFAVGAGIAGNTGDGEVVAQAGFALGF